MVCLNAGRVSTHDGAVTLPASIGTQCGGMSSIVIEGSFQPDIIQHLQALAPSLQMSSHQAHLITLLTLSASHHIICKQEIHKASCCVFAESEASGDGPTLSGTQQQGHLQVPHRAAASGGAAGPSSRGAPAPGLSHDL